MSDKVSFGFAVTRAANKLNLETGERDLVTDEWRVSLPHKCERWAIAGEDYYGDGVSHAEAVQKLEAFIAEARTALATLKERRELGSDLDLMDY